MIFKDAVTHLQQAAAIIEREAHGATGEEREAVLDILDNIDQAINGLEDLTE